MAKEFEKINTVYPRYDLTDVPKGTTYRAMFITPGAVGYKEGAYLVTSTALNSFAWSLKGCPVVIGHQDIEDAEDMREKAVGYVANVECSESGEWYADFVVFCDKANAKIANGDIPYVSCAYRADLSEGEVTVNNVTYKREVLGGEMLHLALVKNPRYNGTEIWRNSTDDCIVSEGVLYNQKDNIMFGFKKTQVELDKETLVNTKSGERTLEELVNALDAAEEKIAEQGETINKLETEKAELEAKLAEKEAAETKTASVTEPTGEPKPETEPEAVEEKPADEGTDEGLKADLNNALTEEVKKVVVRVPDVKI